MEHVLFLSDNRSVTIRDKIGILHGNISYPVSPRSTESKYAFKKNDLAYFPFFYYPFLKRILSYQRFISNINLVYSFLKNGYVKIKIFVCIFNLGCYKLNYLFDQFLEFAKSMTLLIT